MTVNISDIAEMIAGNKTYGDTEGDGELIVNVLDNRVGFAIFCTEEATRQREYGRGEGAVTISPEDAIKLMIHLIKGLSARGWLKIESKEDPSKE